MSLIKWIDFQSLGDERGSLVAVEIERGRGIPHAFEQLAYTCFSRPEYQQLIQQLDQGGPGQMEEKGVYCDKWNLA